MRDLKKWKCQICGQDLIEGQRFVYVPGKGYVHIECFYEEVSRKGLDRDIVALMDANEVLTYAIVRLKEAARIAGSKEIVEEIVKARHVIESLAEELEKRLIKRSL